MNNDLKNRVDEFAACMLSKLESNQHKGNQESWRKEKQSDLLSKLFDEANELQDALKLNLQPLEIINECADVANFAMMIADINRQRLLVNDSRNA